MGVKIDVAIFAQETQRKPLLALAAIFTVKGYAHQMRRQIISNPIVHLSDDFGLVGAGFFLQFA